MKKMILLGFLIIQGNKVECMLRQGVPVLKKGAQELGEGAYNWYTRGKYFSTNVEKNIKQRNVLVQNGFEEIVNKFVRVPGTNEEVLIYTKSFYPGMNFITKLSFVKKVKKPGERKGEQVKYQYDDNWSADVDQLLIVFEEEFINAEKKLLTKEISEFSPKELFERLLNEKLPGLKTELKSKIYSEEVIF